MSSTMDINRKKIEDLKKKRAERLQNTVNESMDTSHNDLKSEGGKERSWSLHKSETIHVAGTLIETYDMEVQCLLQTRSLDSRAPKESQEEEQQIDLLQPREKRKKEEAKKDEAPKDVYELNVQELNSVVKSKHFTDFFHRSSKFVEKMLDNQDGDMIELLLRDGIKTKDKSGKDILAHSITFADSNYTQNRVITDLDWSPQISELFLASYSQNEEGSIKDHVGVALLWNPALRNRPEFYCFCQSAVTSAKFFPFSNSTVLGGCFNGQIVLWDLRVKTMPSQRSGIAPQSHKYPVNSLNVVGTQIANNIASYSNDGIMCLWDIKQFSKPIKSIRLTATQPTRTARQGKSSLLNASALNTSKQTKADSTTSAILEKVTKEEPYEINAMCGRFPAGDANNYYVGSLNGALYKNALHNKSTDKITMYDEHNGPISSLSINNAAQYEALNGLVLTSSFDWTVKLWSPNNVNSLRTFESSEDFVYDVAWNPSNPSLFASANNEGYLDIYDLTRDFQLPIAHEKVSNYAQNKLVWNNEGSAIAAGDSFGSINLYILAEKYRKIDNTKYENFQRSISETREEN